MTYPLIVFDFDGTLADSFPWFLENLNRLAARYRFRRIEPDAVEHLRGLSSRELVAHLELPLWKVPLLTAEMRRRMTEQAAAVRLFDGVGDMLWRLRAHGVDTAVLTSNTRENVERILGPGNVRLIRHFECGASIFGKEARFRRLLKRTGVAPERVLCIGDEIRDAQAAAAAGLAFAGVAWGYTRPDALQAHCGGRMFASVAEMTGALCGGE